MEQARTSGIMRFSQPHDHGGSPCLPTHPWAFRVRRSSGYPIVNSCVFGVQVPEPHRTSGLWTAEPEHVEALGDAALIDEVVVPVCGPVATDLAADRCAERAPGWGRDRGWVAPPDFDRGAEVVEVHDPEPRLVAGMDQDVVPVPQRHHVEVVERAVLRGGLVARQEEGAELGPAFRS